MENWQAFLLLLIGVTVTMGGYAWAVESMAVEKKYRKNWKDPS